MRRLETSTLVDRDIDEDGAGDAADEGFDIGALGFGSPKTIHLILEALKIAFADRFASTGDPAFVKVPVKTLLSKDYGNMRRAEVDPAKAKALLKEPEITVAAVARRLGVVPSTLYRHLPRARTAALEAPS